MLLSDSHSASLLIVLFDPQLEVVQFSNPRPQKIEPSIAIQMLLK